jgi:hypothetical protein
MGSEVNIYSRFILIDFARFDEVYNLSIGVINFEVIKGRFAR